MKSTLAFITLCLLSSSSFAAYKRALCIPEHVMVAGQRVHIKCQYNYMAPTPVGSQWPATLVELNATKTHPLYFAVAGNSLLAAQLITLAQGSIALSKNAPEITVSGKNPVNEGQALVLSTSGTADFAAIGSNSKRAAIEIHYESNDISGTSFGCAANDCRQPIVAFYPATITKGE